MAQLDCTGISKSFGADLVLDDVDLHVEEGEFVVILGPSGCGKSTLLRIIAGIEHQDSGTVAIGGTVVDKIHPRERNVAMVFQNYALYPLMSVFNNMAFSLRIRKLGDDEIKRRITEVATILGITEHLDKRPTNLSGGQRQRVAMGRAMVRNPRVFLFDEPLSNLDAKLRSRMRGEIKSLHLKLATTSVYVTHDQIEAMTMGDRIAVMRNSMIEQLGTPDQIYSQPATLHVATFIGSPEINVLTVKSASAKLDLDGQAMPSPHGVRDGETIYCMRPHDLEMVDASAGGAMAASVDLVEPTGSFGIIHASVASSKLALQVPPDTIRGMRPGDNFHLRINPAKVHLFDPASGIRL